MAGRPFLHKADFLWRFGEGARSLLCEKPAEPGAEFYGKETKIQEKETICIEEKEEEP